MHWKKRMMTPPPDEEKTVEMMSEGGAPKEALHESMKYVDQKSDTTTVRAWDELGINEKCDRLGKWIGYITNQMEKRR